MDLVREVLSRDEQNRAEAAESIKVDRLIPLECFPQDLLVIDTNEINLPELRKNKEDHVLNLARDCVQHLINKISTCPSETKDGKVFIKLEGPAFNLPREKHVPIPKPPTKWQQFAKEKGIKQAKKPKKTWDDILQRWVPTYGYQKAAAEKEKNWVLEVPPNMDPNTDMFAEKSKTKKENVSKNEYQRLRNIAAARKIKVPKVALPPMESTLHVPQLQLAADVARVSTASVGKFQPKLPKEKDLQPKKSGRQTKRLMSTDEEKNMNLNIADRILKKRPKLDLEKAVNKTIHQEETQRGAERSDKKRGKKRGHQRKSDGDGPKKSKNSNSFKRPKSAKGKRVGGGKQKAGGKPKGGGRKRR